MAKPMISLEGFENDRVKVIRRAQSVEHKSARGDAYWVVICKSCNTERIQRGVRIIEGQMCPKCRTNQRRQIASELLIKATVLEWNNLQRAVDAQDLIAIVAAVKTLQKCYRVRGRGGAKNSKPERKAKGGAT